jgi:metal-sulfur cluster biosynthetic enzyme
MRSWKGDLNRILQFIRDKIKSKNKKILKILKTCPDPTLLFEICHS